jgi:protein phosphatase
VQKVIPLHSIVFCEAIERLERFVGHEVISVDAITRQLVGVSRRHDLSAIIFNEVRHRVALKLSLGERVVIDMRGLNTNRCRQLALIAFNQGAAVYTIANQAIFGMGELVRPSVDIEPVMPLPTAIVAHLRDQDWQGVTVIGDVHGELAPLERAFAWARSRQHFIFFLGDIIDYGKQTLEIVDLVHQAVMHGEASLLLANHERKIARWLNRDGEHLRLSDGNRVTIDAIQRLNESERERWIGRFRGLLAHTALSQEIGEVTLLHAAAHPSLWQGTPNQHAIEHYALYGESEQTGGHYKRTHDWINSIPKGKLVIVGHEIVSSYPMIIAGINGGKAVFLDTGCGKGGELSGADLRFTADGGIRLECFKRY